MNELRILIQSKLEEINNLEITPDLYNEILEDGKTYFNYSLLKTFINSDFDKNFSYRIYLNGFIERIKKEDENTVLIIDNIQDEIIKKLKEINMTTSFEDVSVNNGIQKVKATGEMKFTELNRGLL